ncbi:MAG: hypothetical protein ABSG53_31705 [Thermoguttaceae bacterium]|jgi:hypothetical protein
MGTTLLVLLAVAFVGGASEGSRHDRTALENGRIVLDVPPGFEPGRALRLRLSVGAVPHGAKIIVHDAAGNLIGEIQPFGVRPGRKAGLYTIAVPASAIVKGKIPLRFELVPKGAKPRAPGDDEIETVRLDVIPVDPLRGSR